MYRGKSTGFPQRFTYPHASPYLEWLIPLCGGRKRSHVTISHIREDVKRFNRGVLPQPDDPDLKEAIRRTALAFKLPRTVKMLHLNDVFKQKDLQIWSSSPGLPWTYHGYKTKADIRDDPSAIQRVRWFWHRIKAGEDLSLGDCCAFVRSHLVKQDENKVRAVWGYPATVTFGEAIFALPLIEAYQEADAPFAYGFETGCGGNKRIYRTFKGKHFLGVDFTMFDKLLPKWIIDIAFDILAINVDFGNYQDYGIARFDSMVRVFHCLRDYCVKTKIRLCNGERFEKKVGLASGSYFTQLIGGICNYLLLTYSSIKNNVRIVDIRVLGDDSIIGTDKVLSIHDVARALEPLGMEVNTEKSSASDYISNIKFLGYQINDGKPTRDRDRAIAGLVYPERPDRDWDDVASRALGIYHANFGVDEVVDAVCRSIIEKRPFNIQFSRDQQRFFWIHRIEVDETLPTMYDFMRRLNVI
uniref:RdRp n=1 Tax=Hubei partiti-like virus 37 TaxID=1923044 RepID=A0A1L3KLE2_9VIRU|nr:RdRp [Hubei partiti-like virus 37]